MSRHPHGAIALWLAACIVLGAGCEALEPPPTEGPGAPATGSVRASSPPDLSPSPIPTPREVTFAELAGLADGQVVRVVGTIRVPSFTSCTSWCVLELVNSASPDDDMLVSIRVGTGSSPEANTMAALPVSYSDDDLLITADDGTTVRSGDGVALTGVLAVSDTGTQRLTSIGRVEAARAPLPTPLKVTFITITKQKNRSLVAITGSLATGFLVTCLSGRCGLDLEDPTGKRSSVSIEVVRGTKGELRPNTMWPLPSSFRASDLRVVAADGSIVRAGGRVRVTGWLRLSSGRATLDPVVSIVKAAS